jgi:hypothetical protein
MRWEMAIQTFVIQNKNSENFTESNFFDINSRRSYCHLSEKCSEYVTWCMHASHSRDSLKRCFSNVLHKCYNILLSALWKNIYV